MLHCEARAEQSNLLHSRRDDFFRSGIRDMQEGNVHAGGDLVGEFVHGVGAEDDEIRAAAFEVLRALDENLRGFIPAVCVLKFFDLGKVHSDHQALCRMQPAQFFLCGFIDDAVILDG